MAWIGSSPTGESAAQIGASSERASTLAALVLDLGLPVLLGCVAAALHTYLKLRLGIPGHSAVLWLTPLLVARAVSASWGAGSLASTGAAAGLYAMGGFGCAFPQVLEFGTFWIVGPVLDLLALALGGGWLHGRLRPGCLSPYSPNGGTGRLAEWGAAQQELRPPQRRSLLAAPLGVALFALAGVVANLSHLGSKFGFGAIRPHVPRFGLPPVVYDVVTYTVFGLAAGILAYLLSRPMLTRRARGGEPA